MKRFTVFKKAVALVLALLVIASGFSVLSASAVISPGTAYNTATPDEVPTPLIRRNAQLFKMGKASTGAGSGYNINDTSSWKLWWKKDLKYTNAVTGKSETFYANQYVNYHTINKVGSSDKTTVWCIQPYLCIYNDGNYFLTTDGGDKTFINALEKKPKIKNAVAGAIAFGKAQDATKNDVYYYAVQLLSWEFIMGLRNPTTFELYGTKSTSTLNYVKCNSAKKTNDLSDAYDYIIEQLQTYKDVPESDKLFSTISGANGTIEKKKIRLPSEKNSNGEYVGSVDIKSLTKFDDLTYTVVNQNDHKTEKDIKVSVKGTKLKVTSKVNIDSDHTNYTYYVKVSRNLEVVNSTKDSVLQNKSSNSQTITSGMSFTATPSVKYIQIYQRIPPKFGSLVVQKNITSDSDYRGNYSGWYFLYKNTTKGDSKILVTDSDGTTDVIDNIALNSKVEVTELGRKLTSSDNSADYKNIQTISGSKYGIPKDFTDKTLKYTKTIKNAESITVDWENEYVKPFPVKIIKRVDDDTSVSGYYFVVYDLSGKGIIAQPTIVGPTNTDGETSFNLDKAAFGAIGVIELGILKPGHTYKNKLTTSELKEGSFRNSFEIPSRYNPQNGVFAVTGFNDGIPANISSANLLKGFKEIYVDNTTSGLLKIHKQDSITKKPLANAVYGVFYYTQSEVGTTDLLTAPNLVTTLTTDTNGDAVSELISTGRYYVQEISCDAFHAIDKTKYDITITPGSNTELTAIKKTFEDNPSRIVITKREVSSLSTNNQTIANCVIEIYEKPSTGKIDYSKDTPIYSYTTTLKSESIEGLLKVGQTYIVHEKSCPAGFCLAKDIEFTVNTDGSTNTITMYDDTTKIQIAKVDTANKYIAGATLQIQDSAGKAVKVKDYDGNLVESWVSKSTPLTIEGILAINKTYKLVELKSPKGFTIAPAVSFTVQDKNDVQTVKMTDNTTKYDFSKRKLTGTDEFPGNLMVLKEKGASTNLKEWTSTTKPYRLEGVLEVNKTYVLTERKPVDGYTTAESIEFTVGNNGTLQTIVMKNAPTKIQIAKVDTANKYIAGATLQIQDSAGKAVKVKDYDGNLVESWVSKSTPLTIEGILAINKTYKLVELKSPKGFTIAPAVNFTVQDKNDVQTVKMTDNTTKYDFSKRKLTGTDEFPGNLMALKEKGASTNLKEWTSTTKPYRLEGVLEVNKTYVLTERKPVDGYTTAESIEFTVGNNGTLQTIVMKNAPTKIQVAKVDTANKYIAGATLQIQDSAGKAVKVKDYDGNLVESWVSKSTPLTIEGILAINKTYKLVELKSPKGFTIAPAVNFTVQDKNDVQTVKMTDNTTKYDFSKRKLTGTDEFPGNLMALKEKGASTNLKEWTSTTKPYRLEGVLEVNKTYVLTERKPVDGYTTAESIEFTVGNNGTLQTIVMKNAPTKIQIAKVDTANKYVAGATLQIQDSAGKVVKVKDYDGNLVESWVSKSTPLTIEGILAINKTYKLLELKSPKGFTVAPAVSFTVQDKNEVQTVKMTDDTTKVEFVKLAGDTNKILSDCVLSLTDSKGNEIKRWTTTGTPYYLEGVLESGETYTLTEISAKEGYMKAAPITFKVGTDGKKQTITMVDLKYIRPILPRTGGLGSMPFAFIGVVAFIGAAITFIIRRKGNRFGNN